MFKDNFNLLTVQIEQKKFKVQNSQVKTLADAIPGY